VTTLPNVPLVIVSSGTQSGETIARHEQLARLSPQGRHIVAAKSGHWIQFDHPELVVQTIREIVDRARRPRAA
jgi:pimeloyl-ACP methyl ester carboxylesterase